MKRAVTRRRVLQGALGAASALLPGRPRADESETLRIGHLPITDATPLLIAHANGYFADEGLKTARPLRVRSWSTLSESFLTGKFNVVHMLLPIPVWLRFNTKTPVKILAWNHTNGSAVTVAGDDDIKGFKDLGQKQIAVPYWYSMHNIVFQMGLKKAGLTPVIQPRSRPLAKNQVNLFVLPPPEMPVSLSGKKIDGFVVAEPFNAVAELKTRAKIMRFTGDIWMNHPCCVVVMDETLIREKPVFTQKVINGVVRAMRFCIQNPRKTARILSREGGGYLPFSEKTLLRVFTTYSTDIYGPGNVPQAIQHPEWKVRRIGFQPYPYRSATRLILREMADTRMEGDTSFLQTLDVEEAASALVDDTFVKKAVTLAGGPGLFSQIDYQDPWRREEVFEL